MPFALRCAINAPQANPPGPQNNSPRLNAKLFSFRVSVSPRENISPFADAISCIADACVPVGFGFVESTRRNTSCFFGASPACALFAAETLPLIFFSDFFFMAVMRPHHGGMKRARSQSMPSLEALPQACSIAWENAPRLGAFCWQLIEQKPMRLLCCIRRWKRVVVFPARRRSAVR